MKVIKLKRLKVKNFLSVGNKPIEIFFNEKINYITGWNYDDDSANGVGKTTIFLESILFGLFGDGFRKINLDNYINYYNKRELEIEIDLEVNNENYTVIRKRKPDKFIIKKDDVEIQLSSQKETQKFLQQELGIVPEQFKTLFLISANQFNQVVDLQGKVKVKQLIEKIFLSEANFKLFLDAVKKMKKEIRKEIDKKYNDYSFYDGKISSLEEIVIDFNEDQLKEKQKKLFEYGHLYAEIEEKEEQLLNELEEKSGQYKKIIEVKQQVLAEITKLQNKLELLEREERELKGYSQCPVCKREISDELKQKLMGDIIQQKEKIRTKVKEIKEKLEKLEDKIKEHENEVIKIKNKRDELINGKIALKEKIAKIRTEIKSMEEKQNKEIEKTEQIEEYKQKQEMLKEEMEKLEEELKDYELLENILDPKVDISVYGYFSKIIANYVNRNIEKLFDTIGFTIKPKIKEDLSLEILKEERKVDFNNLSQGEKSLVGLLFGLSLWLTFVQLVNKYINVIIIDEFFDSTISENKAMLLLDVLKKFNKKYGIGIYIVSHRNDFKDMFDNVIFLEKRKFTELKI